jgi:flagellar biosynthesis/type III secretory pathway M-ring protein FliF/YscJ
MTNINISERGKQYLKSKNVTYQNSNKMKLKPENPLVGILVVAYFILLAFSTYLTKDSAWFILFSTLITASIGVLIAKAAEKNVKGSAIVAGAIGLVFGAACYFFGI